MRDQDPSAEPARATAEVRDLQAKLYREIGISAVAAALRFTTIPEPNAQVAVDPVKPRTRTPLAA